MDYFITSYSYEKARDLGVEIEPSTNQKKKIDVYKSGVKVCEIGAKNYNDFPTYLNFESEDLIPKGTAYERRRLYKKRHKYDKTVAGFYANRILW